jgi:hypothetical protein
LGEQHPTDLRLSAAHNQLHIDFFGLSFASESHLRYQYKLSGGEASDWSPASDQQAVDIAGLGPGRYRFSVRAVNAEGLASPTPGFAFVIDAGMAQLVVPFRRLCRSGLATFPPPLPADANAGTERVRMRIATDLHDDIGSTLSQISVLSEVLLQKMPHRPDIAETLSSAIIYRATLSIRSTTSYGPSTQTAILTI